MARSSFWTPRYRLAPDVSQEVRGERVSVANVRRRYPDAEFIDSRTVMFEVANLASIGQVSAAIEAAYSTTLAAIR